MDISGVMIGPMWKHHDASTVLITWLPAQSHALELLPLHRDKPLGDLAAKWQPTGVRMARCHARCGTHPVPQSGHG